VRFFEIFGRNPIFIYIFAIILDRAVNLVPIAGQGAWKWLGKSVVQPVLPGPPGSLLCAIGFMLACWLTAWALDRKNIVIKV
jgi:predicted acyltransferase